MIKNYKILSIRDVADQTHTELKVFAARQGCAQGQALELALDYANKYLEILNTFPGMVFEERISE